MEKNVMYLHDALQIVLNMIDMKRKGMECAIPYIIGAPGGGKTQMLQCFCKQNDFNFISFSPGLEPLEKMSGIPEIVTNNNEFNTVWTVPEFICKIRELASNEKDTIVLFDDWHTASAEIQSIGFELFTYHKLSSHPLPRNAHFVLAGNEKSSAGAKIQLSAIRNRCSIVRTKPNIQYWINEFAIPNKLPLDCISFFENPTYSKYFHEEESTTSQFGSPRQWTSIFNIIKYYNDTYNKIDYNVLLPVISSGCSEEATTAFFSYYKIFKDCDVSNVFINNEIDIPSEFDKAYIYTISVINEFYKRYNKDITNETKRKFVLFLDELYNVNKELISIVFNNICSRPKIDEYNIPSGIDIIKDLIVTKMLTKEQLTRFNNISRSIFE